MPKVKEKTKVRSWSPYPLERTNNSINPIVIEEELGDSSQNPIVIYDPLSSNPHEPLAINEDKKNVKPPEVELDTLCQGIQELTLRLPHIGTQILKHHMHAEADHPGRRLICREIRYLHSSYRRTHHKLLSYYAHLNLDYILPPAYCKVMSGLRQAARQHRTTARRLIQGNPEFVNIRCDFSVQINPPDPPDLFEN